MCKINPAPTKKKNHLKRWVKKSLRKIFFNKKKHVQQTQTLLFSVVNTVEVIGTEKIMCDFVDKCCKTTIEDNLKNANK